MCICVCVCVPVWVCVEETVCFCGSSNQPPAHSPNTCSPINMQCAGPLALLSPSTAFSLFFLLHSFFHTSFLPPWLFSTLLCSLLVAPTLHLLFLSLVLNSLASLLFPSRYRLLHHIHPLLPFSLSNFAIIRQCH